MEDLAVSGHYERGHASTHCTKRTLQPWRGSCTESAGRNNRGVLGRNLEVRPPTLNIVGVYENGSNLDLIMNAAWLNGTISWAKAGRTTDKN